MSVSLSLDARQSSDLRAQPASRTARTAPPHALLLGLQRSAGNAAVARQLALQRCGPVPCDCSEEERAEYNAAHPAGAELDVGAPVQRHGSGETGPSVQRDGVMGWLGDQFTGAANAATSAARWAGRQGAAAVDAVSGMAGSAASVLLESQRAAVLGQIQSARARLGGLRVLPATEEQLARLNGHLSRLGATSGGRITLPQVTADGAVTPSGLDTVTTGTIGGLLTGLLASVSTPASGEAPVQRDVQRLMDPATAAALAAAAAAAETTVEVGAAPAAVAAPETAGISLAVLAIVALVVAVVVAIIVYATYSSSTTPTTSEPVMPEGLSREKKEKWRQCSELYRQYKKGIGQDVSQQATDISSMKDDYSNGRLNAAQKRELCAKVHRQLQLVQELINARRRYMDRGCDEFDWFNRGTTEDQRRQDHQGELNNVRASEGNLRALLAKLQKEGVC